jgi:KDO2-lipid IV(A) lauroyltransferase
MNYIGHFFFKLHKALISILSFKMLYVYSDINTFLLRYVFRYRITTVRKNLKKAFPEKSPKELNEIMSKFYWNLCDVVTSKMEKD